MPTNKQWTQASFYYSTLKNGVEELEEILRTRTLEMATDSEIAFVRGVLAKISLNTQRIKATFNIKD